MAVAEIERILDADSDRIEIRDRHMTMDVHKAGRTFTSGVQWMSCDDTPLTSDRHVVVLPRLRGG